MEVLLIAMFVMNTFTAACAARWLTEQISAKQKAADEARCEAALQAREEKTARDLMDEGFENIMRYSTTGKDLMGGDDDN